MGDVRISLPTPQPKQEEFLRATTPYVAFGGARGGGKSWAVRFKAISLALTYAGIKLLILRRTFAELEGNHIRPLVADTAGIARYRDKDKTLTFFNGSMVKFGYCDTEGDVIQYQGQEFDVIFFDEATNFTEYQFNTIRACRRGVNGFPKRIYLTCNPGGVGHGWVKRLFVDRRYKEGETPEDYTFIRSYVYDNHALMESDPDYVKDLQTLPEDLRRAWLEGDWDVYAGQYFSEWRYDRHVIEPIEIPSHWTRVVALDYGLDMLAVVWGAFDEQGRGYIYRELCQPELPVSEAVEAILSCCDDDDFEYTSDGTRKPLSVCAPPDLWGRTVDKGVSIAEQFRQRGVHFYKADNNRQNGWMNIKEWLQIPDGEEKPKLQIFGSCTELIRCLPLLQYAKKSSLDCATEPHDITHAPDALRYLLQTRPRKAKAIDTRTEAQIEADKISQYKHDRLYGAKWSSKLIRR